MTCVRRLASVIVAAFVVPLFVVATAGPAVADTCPRGTTPSTSSSGKAICIPVVDKGETGGSDPGGGTPGGSGSHQTCTFNGKKIPCVSDEGVWFSSKQCYAKPADPQPKPDDPVWGGNDPTKGTMWTCGRAHIEGGEPGIWYFFVPTGTTPTLVDPGELAQEALETMDLAVPDVHLAPTPPDMTYVNIDTWLWMSQGKFTTLSKTVTAGGTSVTVTAQPVRSWWEMGDGGEVSCSSPGVAWKSWMTDAATTDCSYAYKKTSKSGEDGMFTVSAAIWYQADWTCSGACLTSAGTLDEVSSTTDTEQIRVGERQSVVVDGSN